MRTYSGHTMPPEKDLNKMFTSMIKKNFSHVLLNSATLLSQSFCLFLIRSGPLPLPFLISFPNFEIKPNLREVMGCKEIFPGSEKQTRLSVPYVKQALST